MTHTVLPRVRAARLRTMCIVATVLSAVVALSAAPAVAATRHRRVHHARARAAVRHHAHHRPRCADSHARIGRVPRRAIEHATLCLLNHQRHERGLPRLRDSSMLVSSAQRWTNTMVHDRAFSHGSDFGARISAAGFDWSRIGENIADGYRTAAGAVRAWMASVGHCQNILDPAFREVGAGFDNGSALSGNPVHGTWTLDFALGMRQRVRSNDWAPAEGCPYR